VLTDRGFNDILYVVPQHTLGVENARDHGVQYTTIHRLIGIDCRPWKNEKAMPSVCLIDEMTMIEAEWIEKAIRMYPYTLFFVAGDVMENGGKTIAMQCRNGKPGAFNKVFSGLPIKYFTVDRRSQDGQLKELKKLLREKMVEFYTDGEAGDARRLAHWVASKYPVRKLEFDGGVVLAGTHKTHEKLLEMGIVSGYLSNRNERSYEAVEGWKKRGSFTTHSFQGSTIRNGNVFIVINDSFELAMIYTAVSRAVRIEQINFVTV
jgi:hypothetical protein